MKQLLRSLGRINRAKQQSDRHFQAHIFFDNGVRHNRLTPFALQLVVVAGKALGNIFYFLFLLKPISFLFEK